LKRSPKSKNHTTKQKGDLAEDRALAYLLDQGMVLLQRNYRTPGRGGGEIDLVMRGRDQTLVFVEVRCRESALFGGANASIGPTKRRRIVRAAQFYLHRLGYLPACRFDVVCIDAGGLQWLPAAFDANG